MSATQNTAAKVVYVCSYKTEQNNVTVLQVLPLILNDFTYLHVPLFCLPSCPSCPVHLNRVLIFHLLTKLFLLSMVTRDISCPLTAVGSSISASAPRCKHTQIPLTPQQIKRGKIYYGNLVIHYFHFSFFQVSDLKPFHSLKECILHHTLHVRVSD